MNEQIDELDQHLTGVMAKIREAASKHDLPSVQRLTRKAVELQDLKTQVAAIRQRIVSLVAEEVSNAPAVERPSKGELRRLPIDVTKGDIRQNLLKLTPHIQRGKIQVGEELVIEALPSKERFQTVVLDNRLRARGEIGRFYRDANIQPDDFVLLTEETPGRWTLKKAVPGEFSRYS